MEHWPEWLLGLYVSLLSFVGLKSWSRQDEAERALNELQRNCVTRDDLYRTVNEIREDKDNMHAENRLALNELKGSIKNIETTVNQVALQVASLGSRRPRS